ncbi:MAG: orotidine-5'-phosphate decarboxylase [Chloroflexi bacterium]|nr:orotidine-5'-phosphate decarboxylase [Chloroflexota bacterium]
MTLNKFEARAAAVESLLCVGLDSRLDKLPAHFVGEEHPQFAFNRWIIEQTHPFVSAYKPNFAFYEVRGASGWHELALTMDYLRTNHPYIFTIADAKRADIGTTNEGYVTAIFDELGFDAITLHPYPGKEALAPFLERDDKTCIILCHTSNPGAGELQELVVDGSPLYLHLAHHVATEWNSHNNCMLVVGATAPEQLRKVRETVGDMTLLVPGIGAQGGDLAAVLAGGLNRQGRGLIINVSRSVIFADNPAAAAQQYRDSIEQYRQQSFSKM